MSNPRAYTQEETSCKVNGGSLRLPAWVTEKPPSVSKVTGAKRLATERDGGTKPPCSGTRSHFTTLHKGLSFPGALTEVSPKSQPELDS